MNADGVSFPFARRDGEKTVEPTEARCRRKQPDVRSEVVGVGVDEVPPGGRVRRCLRRLANPFRTSTSIASPFSDWSV